MNYFARNSVKISLSPIALTLVSYILIAISPSEGHASVGIGWGIAAASLFLCFILMLIGCFTSCYYLLKNRKNDSAKYSKNCKYALAIEFSYILFIFIWLAN